MRWLIHHGLAARDDGLKLIGVQVRSIDPRTIDVTFLGKINDRGRHTEGLDHVIGNGIQQLQNVVSRQQLLTEAVKAFQFTAPADRFFRLLPRPIRQLTGDSRRW